MTYIPKVPAEQTLFLTTSSLGQGGVFTSSDFLLEGFTQVQTEILIGNANFGAELVIEFLDGIGGTVIRQLEIPILDGKYELFSAPAFCEAVRYTLANLSQGTITVYLTTKALTVPLSAQVSRLDSAIFGSMVANLGRTVLLGQDSNGNFNNISTNGAGHLEVSVSSPLSAFGDLRNAEITPQVVVTFESNLNTRIVEVFESSGGTAIQQNAMAFLQSGTGGGTVSVTTIGILKYRAGLGALTRFTGKWSDPDTTDSADMLAGTGYPLANGLFFGYATTEAGFGILRVAKGTRYFTKQSQWNIDTMDGTSNARNPSGQLLNPKFLNVFEIQYQYLGAGQLTFYVENNVNGEFTPVHAIRFTNLNEVPSLFNPSNPLILYVDNKTGVENVTLQSSSMAGFVEGKNIVTGPAFVFGNTKTVASGTETALFTIRNKTTFGSSNPNTVRGLMRGITCANDANNLAVYNIYEDATLGGTPAYTDIDTDGSVMESDVAGTTVTGGLLFASLPVSKNSGASFNLKDLEILMKPSSTYTVAVLCGSAGDQSASLSWVDDF